MKKLLLFILTTLLLVSSSLALSNEPILVVDDTSPASDLILVSKVRNNFAEFGEDSLFNSMVSRQDLNDKLAVFVYKTQVLIIIGDEADAEYAMLATKIEDYLKNEQNIVPIMKLVSEVSSDDFTKEMGPLTTKNFFVVDETAPATDQFISVQLIDYIELDIGAHVSKLNSEVKRTDLNNKLTVFVYGRQALIVKGDYSPYKYNDKLTAKIKVFLKETYDISSIIKLSSEIRHDNLIEELDDPRWYAPEMPSETAVIVEKELSEITPIEIEQVSISEAIKREIDAKVEKLLKCHGCLNEKDLCIPFGTRVDGRYCDLSQEIRLQKSSEIMCENNFECKSNLCVDSQCIEPGFFSRMIRWFRRIF